MQNVLTVDLEDWFSVETLQSAYDHSDWKNLTSVVERNTDNILDLFWRKRVRGTFFVLGWVAEHNPGLITRVAAEGHEIACHSYLHRMVSTLTPEEFRRDTERAIGAIFASCGVHPTGYRSPSWGMKLDMTWAFDILADMGFIYDSSIYPIQHDIYGDPKAPREAFLVNLSENRQVFEIPATTISLLGQRFPVGGGGWLRQLPYWFTRHAIRKLNRAGIPAVVYFHPWELDPGIPRVELPLKNRLRQYANLNTMQTKIEKLLEDFDFITMADYIDILKKQDRDVKK